MTEIHVNVFADKGVWQSSARRLLHFEKRMKKVHPYQNRNI